MTIRGGPRDNAGGARQKITREVIETARALRADGLKFIVIASELGISITAAWRACNSQ